MREKNLFFVFFFFFFFDLRVTRGLTKKSSFYSSYSSIRDSALNCELKTRRRNTTQKKKKKKKKKKKRDDVLLCCDHHDHERCDSCFCSSRRESSFLSSRRKESCDSHHVDAFSFAPENDF